MAKTKKEYRDKVSTDRITNAFMLYKHGLNKLVSRFVRSTDVEDVVQEAFVRTYQTSLASHIEHPKTYLYTAARNIAITYATKKHMQVEDLVDDFDSHVLNEDRTAEKIMESQEKLELFCSAVDSLPEKCREVFVMKRVYGYSQKEIADKMEISERTVERHVAKGAFRCAVYMEENGYDILSGKKVSDTGSNGGLTDG